jgi:acetoin:2,6-dichlorophenolindophenol oxidoreductase subunit beta
MSMRLLTTAEAAREAAWQLLNEDKSVFVIGEGVVDPKGAFGTTKDLHKEFPEQVFDMPVSENGMTGVCVGAAAQGMRPILIHMRADFLLYSFDQLINNAAKFHSMYGGQTPAPMVVKAFLGKGWGSGHQHSQNLESMLAHVPGLKVVTPSSAKTAKGLLIAAAKDHNPVVILEHRWLHPIKGEVPEEMYLTSIGQAEVLQKGADLTLVSWGYATVEVRRALDLLKEHPISVEHIDLLTLRPMDIKTVVESAKKTRRLLVVNEGWRFGGLAGEIITSVVGDHGVHLKSPPIRLTHDSHYPASSHFLTKKFYFTHNDVAYKIARMFNLDVNFPELDVPHDIPDPLYIGPF